MSFVVNRIILLLSLAFFLKCTENIAGKDSGGTETTNALVVITEGMSVRGYAPDGTNVIICNDSYNPLHGEGFIDSVAVDSSESFIFNSIRTKGTYNIFSINKGNRTGALISSFNLDEHSKDSMHATLDSLGAICGTVLYVNRTGTDTVAGINTPVYLQGTWLCSKADSAGVFHFLHIPAGSYTVKLDQPLTIINPAEKVVLLDSSKLTVNVTFISKEGGE